MVTQEIIEYVRQNLAQGFAQADIEKTLLESGWNKKDVDSVFFVVANGASSAPTTPTPAPATMPASDPTSEVTFSSVTELESTGIIGFLFRAGVVSTVTQANAVLIGVSVLCMGLAAWFIFK